MDRFVQIDSEIRQNLVRSSAVFIDESLKFIQSMMIKRKLSKERGRRYIKEILHSIFFICYIYREPKKKKKSTDPEEFICEMLKPDKLAIYPGDILKKDLHSKLSEKFPDVFQSYASQLPRRPPFSVLLEVVVETTVDRKDSDVLKVLKNLNDNMVVPGCRNNTFANVFCLGASVVSFCYFERSGQETQRYFGASISCSGKTATRIFIYVACIETWNDNVAYAVCLAAKHHTSIRLPDVVCSTACCLKRENNTLTYSPKLPCLLCLEIFSNIKFSPLTQEQKKPEYNYGNCAECEAISNLLNGEISVSEEMQELNAGLVPSLMTLREEQENRLRGHLTQLKFKVNPEARFYNPELHSSATFNSPMS